MNRENKREQIAKLRSLQKEFPELTPQNNSTYLGNVAIIGASNASGFGANLGRAVLNSHPDNRLILSARGKKLETLKSVIDEGSVYDPSRTTAIEFDVTLPSTNLDVNPLDHLVVCPAYMNPKFLKRNVKFGDIPLDEIELSRKVTLKGFTNSVNSFPYNSRASAWGVSFAGHDFPGYNIGPIKRELEELILGDSQREGLRQNVLSLGVFESVAGLGIEGFSDAQNIYGSLGITNPSLSDMVYGAVDAMKDKTKDKEIVDLDGGLRAGLETPEGRNAYLEFCSALSKE